MDRYVQDYKKETLEKLIKETEDFFVGGSEGEIYHFVLEMIEKSLIEKALERAYGNQIRTAKILGINRNTLHSKIKKLDIDVNRFKR